MHLWMTRCGCTRGRCDACGRCDAAATKAHTSQGRGPTYRVAAAIKGSSHRVDQHGTCHVQVHDATRATTAGPSEYSRRTCEPGGAHAFAGACVTLAWHKARACKVCAPSSVALASIALLRLREPAQGSAVDRKHAGHIPAPLQAVASSERGGHAGHIPAPLHCCRPTTCLGARRQRRKMRLVTVGRSFHGWA